MSSAFPKIATPKVTLHHLGLAKLVGLCQALRQSPEQTSRAVDVFETLTQHWAHASAEPKPAWPSDITDDGTPFEFSVSFHEGGADLRMLVEPQTRATTLSSNWNAGLEINQLLRERYGAHNRDFDKVADLFAPAPGSNAQFSIWHAAVLRPDGTRLFKVYLNPRVRGAGTARDLVNEALERLGRRDVAERLAPALADDGSEPRYFSLDLEEARTSRVKVYVGRSDNVEAIDRLASSVSDLAPGEAAAWVERLSRRRERFAARPILTCFAFDNESAAATATVHVPVRCYVKNDAESADAVCGFLSPLQAASFRRVLSALSPCSLKDNTGLITYASLRKSSKGPRVTVYLAPQVYSFGDRRRHPLG
jgi:GNAT superfamily N-acetyltransferase